MNYKVIKIEYINKPLSNPDDSSTLIQNVNVTMGVDGNVYDEMSIENTYQVLVPVEGLLISEFESFVDAEAERLARLKYPNIIRAFFNTYNFKKRR